MEDHKSEEDEFLDFWARYNDGIEQLDLVSPEDKPENEHSPAKNDDGIELLAVVPAEHKSENAQSPAKNDGGAENDNDTGLINHGLGIQLHQNAAETDNKGLQISAGINQATANAVQVPMERDNGSEDKGGVPIKSAAPEGPMTREEIILKWLSGVAAAQGTEDDLIFQELASSALDPVEQEWGKNWGRNRRATGVPRQIPNYRFFDYRTGTYSDVNGAPPPK